MRGSCYFATVVLLSILLSSSSQIIKSDGKRSSDSRHSLNSEWRILTEHNFSSEIRLHPHILLLVTIPWSGEARFFMKQLGKLVADEPEKLDHLRLMVVHKNSQKKLANMLGASDDLTLYYYHQFTSYKYHGRFSAEKILSSVNYFMSLTPEEVPLKPLNTQNELHLFLKSTDKAVLLIELCGWSSKLLHKRSDRFFASTPLNYSENDNLLERVDESLQLGTLRNQKGLINKGTHFHVENEMPDSHWAGEFSQANSSIMEEMELKTADTNLFCTKKYFKQFKSFFFKFEMLAREFFLPPERIRFGLISEKSLLPYVGVNTMEAWLVILQFNGCPSCSIALKEEDDLKKILLEHHCPIVQLDVDGPNPDPAFPANRPSFVLFIDRLSESRVIREKSKLALDAFWKLEKHYQKSDRVDKCMQYGYSHSPLVQGSESQKIASDSSSPGFLKEHRSFKVSKMKDDMATNQGQSILSDRTASNAVSNAVYDSLLDFISSTGNRKKQTKISLVAKENGFQLLSDDFDVQVIDSSPFYEKAAQLSDTDELLVMSPGGQTSEICQPPNDDSVNKDNDLLAAIEVPPVVDTQQAAVGDADDDIQKYLETDIVDKNNPNIFGNFINSLINEDDKRCKKNDMGSLVHHDENYELKQEGYSAETCTEKDDGNRNVPPVNYVDDLGEIDGAQVKKNVKSVLNKKNFRHQPFLYSFFFIDGEYRLLNSMTGGSNLPSLVLLDPAVQHHYIFTEDRDIEYSFLLNFVEKFLNGSLSPYHPSAPSVVISKEAPRPPFVNLDFHEINAIPRVTTNTFCELVFGFKPCDVKSLQSTFQAQNFGIAWKTDVLVLFGSSWCGFCQRMELLVREVYRAFNNLKNMQKCESNVIDSVCFQDNRGDAVEYSLPSIFLIDCAQNDCGSFLKAVGRNEHYPELILYPAQNKRGIPYEGSMLVVNIINFIVSKGSNSQYLSKYKGYLWKHSLNNIRGKIMDPALFLVRKTDPYFDDIMPPSQSPAPNSIVGNGRRITPGYILSATAKLQDAIPFNNATILVTLVDEGEAVHGVILNKPLTWNIFEDFDHDMENIKQALLFYGGPVRAQGLPLVSLTRRLTEGYMDLIPGVYFSNPMITSMVIEGIKSGDRSSLDYWFFLGYSSWTWNQLFGELDEGNWRLSDDPIKTLDWPKSAN